MRIISDMPIMQPPPCLMVILNDVLSDIVAKGEVIERYYNPDDVFKTVHIVLVNNDKPDLASLVKIAGQAQLFIHNLPPWHQFIWRTLGCRQWLLRKWALPAVSLAGKIRPSIIRCFGVGLNGWLALEIKRSLGIPYIVSLHTHPDANIQLHSPRLKERIRQHLFASTDCLVLKNAEKVIPVYHAIASYLRRLNVTQYTVLHNVINAPFLYKKERYSIDGVAKVLCVGQQILGKNPENLLRAIATIANIHLTLIGDGPIRDKLIVLSNKLGIADRVKFVCTMPNDILCSDLHNYDIFAVVNEYPGISKAMLEALLCGLPVIHNRIKGYDVRELESCSALIVDTTEEAYRIELIKLLSD